MLQQLGPGLLGLSLCKNNNNKQISFSISRYSSATEYVWWLVCCLSSYSLLWPVVSAAAVAVVTAVGRCSKRRKMLLTSVKEIPSPFCWP